MSGPGQPRDASRSRERRHRPDLVDHLRTLAAISGIGRSGRPPLEREDLRHGERRSRIDGEAVERLGGKRHHAAAAKRADRPASRSSAVSACGSMRNRSIQQYTFAYTEPNAPQFGCRTSVAGIALSVRAAPPLHGAAHGVTFNKDIAPLLWQNCASCHRPGQPGPFSLVTFDDVRPRAREIAARRDKPRDAAVEARAGHGEFAGVRRLTDAQIALDRALGRPRQPRGRSGATCRRRPAGRPAGSSASPI